MAIDFSNDVELVSVTVPGPTQVVTISVPGIQGPPGKFKVGTVTTGAPGTSAAITTTENAQGEQVVNFTIPRGDVGTNVARTPVASTINPTSTYLNQWARVAQIRFTGQYQDAVVELKLIGNGSGAANPSAADIVWRVKQQNAMAAVPFGSLYINNPLGGMTTADFSAVTEINSATETVVGLYIRARNSYDTLYLYERSVTAGNYVTFYTNATFIGTTLPAGTGTVFPGTDNPTDIKLGTTSTTAAAGDHTHAGLTADAVATTASIRTLGTGAQQAAAGNHTHSGLTADAVATTASIRTLGTGAQQAAAGNHTHNYAAATHSHAISDLTATGTRDATTFLRGDGTWSPTPAAQGAADATTTTKGLIQLAGDLGGTAAAPTVPGLSGKANATHTHGVADISATGTRSSTTFLRGDGTWSTTPAAAGAVDATSTVKGIIQLAGDLGGTAAAPTVPGLSNKANSTITISAGTGLSGGGDLTTNRTLTVSYGSTAGTAVQGNDARVTADQAAATASIRTLGTGALQAAAGNHTHSYAAVTHTHTKSEVGLANVDNTSDASKPVSTAQQTALDAKAPLTGVEGIKVHDGTAGGGARPTGYARVRWIGGSSRPTNMVTGDVWEHDA